MNTWYSFLIALGLFLLAVHFLLTHSTARLAAAILAAVAFAIAAILALPALSP
ncbi:MAG: hypothetical protein ACRDRO_30810 [Pseudonocardiaceae bacterium]